MSIFETKEEKIKRLEQELDKAEREVASSESSYLYMKEELANAAVEMEKQRIRHIEEIHQARHGQDVLIADLKREIEVLEENYTQDVEDGLVDGNKKLAAKEDQLDKAHADRTKKLEAEYAAKLAKVDRDLEADKASYRKYMRTELNKEVDTLRAENLKLIKENATLTGENNIFKNSQSFFTGRVESMNDFANKLVGALPTVSAEITTPVVTVTGGTTATNSQKPQGEQKKN